MSKNKFFRSGIHGGLNISKGLLTPEEDSLDESVKDTWLKTYIEIRKTQPRNEARIVADEAVEDYLEKFDGD